MSLNAILDVVNDVLKKTAYEPLFFYRINRLIPEFFGVILNVFF